MFSISSRSSWTNLFFDPKQVIFVDRENLIDAYSQCPHLQIIINKRADMGKNGILKKRNRKTKKTVPNATIPYWLLKPNPIQDFGDFYREWVIYNSVYGNYFIYPNRPFEKSEPSTIVNLIPEKIKITPTGRWIDQTKLDGIISKVEFIVNGAIVKTFKPSEIIMGCDGISRSPFIAESKLINLQWPISNIVGSLKTRNKFIYNGPKIIISSNSKDSDGGIPFGDPERQNVERQLSKDYGEQDNQSNAVLSTASLTSEKIDYPTKDLMLFEEEETDAYTISAEFGINKYLLPWSKDATFENTKRGEIETYQNTIIPESERFCKILDRIDNDEVNEYFMDYSHLPILQEDKKSAADINKVKVETAEVLWLNGMITDDEFAQSGGYEKRSGDGKQKQSTRVNYNNLSTVN